MNDIFTADHAPIGEPYWWQERVQVDPAPVELARLYDVAIVGSGFTGITAALELAEAGQSVLVIEAETIGYGASTRNGGMLTPLLGKSPASIASTLGRDAAEAMYRETAGLVDFVGSQVARYGIDADFQRTVNFTGAMTEVHYRSLEAEIPELEAAGLQLTMVPPGSEDAYIRTRYYRGGRAFHNCGAVHPAKYHRGLVKAAVDRGVALLQQCRVNGVTRIAGNFELVTSKGTLRSRQVILATNGYDSHASGWHRRRVVPILSSIIATEVLGQEGMKKLLPDGAIINDTKRILSYFRPSPDGRRLLFGGRASFRPISDRETARRLRLQMLKVFPQLDGTKITHTWSGFVGFTFDHLPHTGRHDGVDYAMGCNGSGVAMGSWLGQRMARRMLGDKPSAFELPPFKTVPGYTGDPWVLPLIGEYYRLRDWLERRT
jgi:glycine/D-amino acid oxidase-like deaminating enzyme